ncbi:MAG: fibronectin type III domain-containing protein, partial [Actinobacteria bacterium]
MNPHADQTGPAARGADGRAPQARALARTAIAAGALLITLVAVAGTAAGTAVNSLPGAPDGVKASRGETGTVAQVAWTAAPAGAGVTSYRVWRAEGDGDFAPIAAVSAPSYTDRIGVPGASYRYQVTACAANGGESLPSAVTDTLTVEWSISPHYGVKTGQGATSYCRVCHLPHSADT